MKVFLLAVSLSFSFAALAFTEVECDARSADGKRAQIEVETGLGGGMRDATVTVRGDRGTNPEVTRYRVTSARRFGSQILYTGMNKFRLDIDLFPDQVPRWGQTYFARFSNFRNVRCHFNSIR